MADPLVAYPSALGGLHGPVDVLHGPGGVLETLHRPLALLELHGLMFVEPNPSPVKAALAATGKMSAAVRLPLVPASEGLRRQIVEAMGRLESTFK